MHKMLLFPSICVHVSSYPSSFSFCGGVGSSCFISRFTLSFQQHFLALCMLCRGRLVDRGSSFNSIIQVARPRRMKTSSNEPTMLCPHDPYLLAAAGAYSGGKPLRTTRN